MTQFFITGGTLAANTRSYIERGADAELLDYVSKGDYCYVLTTRQMGKSSLVMRARQGLATHGTRSVYIDLTEIGTATVNPWYLGLLKRVADDLGLEVDLQAWWERQDAAPTVRFTDFLRTVALPSTEAPLVIFIDEIDFTLAFPFREDFFAAVRAMHAARPRVPAFYRLSFVFVGVATPDELIDDPRRTPFNIGREIALGEFSYDEARQLRDAVEERFPRQGDRLLKRVFEWTNGHPYLTQRLCLALVESPDATLDDAGVDLLVQQVFFVTGALRDRNIAFVQDRVEGSEPAQRRRMLRLYDQVYSGKTVRDSTAPGSREYATQKQLELAGLVRVQGEHLQTRNHLYHTLFNRSWIAANTPRNRQRRNAFAAVATALLVAAGVLAAIFLQRSETQALDSGVCTAQFRSTTSAAARVIAAGCLVDLQEGERAQQLFYALQPEEQLAAFSFDEQSAASVGPQVVQTVRLVYDTLSIAPDGHDIRLLDKIGAALALANQPDTEQLIGEIRNWREGREAIAGGEYARATTRFDAAQQLNPQNALLHYDAALSRLGQRDAPHAVVELDTAAWIAAQHGLLVADWRTQPVVLKPLASPIAALILGRPELRQELLSNPAAYPNLAFVAQPLQATATLAARATASRATADALAARQSATSQAGATATSQVLNAQATASAEALSAAQTATAAAVPTELPPPTPEPLLPSPLPQQLPVPPPAPEQQQPATQQPAPEPQPQPQQPTSGGIDIIVPP